MTLQSKILAGIVAVLALLLGYQTLRAEHYKDASFDNALEASKARAEADSGAHLHGKQLQELRKMYGDSVQGFRQLLVQEKISRSGLDRELAQLRRVNVDLNARVQGLQVHVTTNVPVTVSPGDSSGRHAEFRVRKIPYTALASVDIYPPPKPATLDLRVDIDPIQVGVGVACSTRAVSGVREASITLAFPSWVNYSMGTRQISPEVCSPEPQSRRHWRLGAGVGFGWTLGASRPGPSALVGILWSP